MAVAAFVLIGFVFSTLSWLLVLGFRSPARFEVEVSEEFSFPLLSVYDAIANIPEYPSWRTGVQKVELIGPVETSDGERFSYREFRKGAGSKGVVYVVADDTPPAKGPGGLGRRVHRIVGGTAPYRSQWIFGFEPRGQRTKLTVIEQGEIGNPLLRGVARIFMPPRKALNQFLMDLRGHLQKGGTAHLN